MQKLTKLAFIGELGSLEGQLKIINSLYDEAKKNWKTYFDNQSGVHFIEATTVSQLKSESLNGYISYLVKLHFNSVGGYLRGFSKSFLETKNEEYIQLQGTLSALPNLIHRKAFTFVCVFMLGYDESLIELALDTRPGTVDRFNGSIEFMCDRFDLDKNYPKVLLENLSETVVAKFYDTREEYIMGFVKEKLDYLSEMDDIAVVLLEDLAGF